MSALTRKPLRYLILHPTTGDRARAEDHAGAVTAQRWLRREATERGVSPRITPLIVHNEGS